MTWIAARLAAAALLAAAWDGDEGGNSGADKAPPVARPEDFPKPGGKTIEAQPCVRVGRTRAGAVRLAAPAWSNRFGFGLFDRARNQVTDVPVALYVAPVSGGAAKGPFLARYESLKVAPQFQSRTVSSDPDAARSVYVADVRSTSRRLPDPRPGPVRRPPGGGRPGRAGGPRDSEERGPGGGGEALCGSALRTTEDADGDIKKIDTREPPSSMHDAGTSRTLGKKPVVLLFATPLLCQSRVRGPVVDIAEEVKAKRGDEAEFIVQETYTDNEVDRRLPPAGPDLQALRPEPWLFTIDRGGVIRARIEGAVQRRRAEQGDRRRGQAVIMRSRPSPRLNRVIRPLASADTTALTPIPAAGGT